MSSKQLLGVAGVHYVTAKLARLGLHVVPTTRNVKGPDIFVGNEDGDLWFPIQVKTTQSAERTRGRGENKVLDRYEWDSGGVPSSGRTAFSPRATSRWWT